MEIGIWLLNNAPPMLFRSFTIFVFHCLFLFPLLLGFPCRYFHNSHPPHILSTCCTMYWKEHIHPTPQLPTTGRLKIHMEPLSLSGECAREFINKSNRLFHDVTSINPDAIVHFAIVISKLALGVGSLEVGRSL
ncbi:hypothetical protein BX600DRAFT_147867 [Xylariales sp. PMI_506]|nr:hypothetical protein BX600DRAFT_147867 [Xylariales sp. PMI_506]